MIQYVIIVLKVYDILGREVATLVDEMQTVGYKSATFNASNLSSGVYIYIYMLRAGTYDEVKKMVIAK